MQRSMVGITVGILDDRLPLPDLPALPDRNRSEDLGCKALVAGDLTGNLRLVHALWRVQAPEGDQEIEQGKTDQQDEKENTAEDCASAYGDGTICVTHDRG